MSENYLISYERMTGIANAVRSKRELQGLAKDTPINPARMQSEINKLLLGVPITISSHIGDDGKWHRPSDWPDLDSLQDWKQDDADVLYLTYDNRSRDEWISLNGDNLVIEQGYVSNSVFTAEQTDEESTVACIDRDYVAVRVTPKSGYHLTDIRFKQIPASSTGCVLATPYYYCRCVERVGSLPYHTTFTRNSSQTYGYGCRFLEREKTINVCKNGVAQSDILDLAWIQCFSLQSLDVSGWDTSSWNVTSLDSTWNLCCSLRSLDLSGWDTSNWHLSDISYAWSSCYSLESLDLSGWNTGNWAITSLDYTWYNCFSLHTLDVSSWNTSGWPIASMNYTWYYCYSLQRLDLSAWDTGDWPLASLYGTWGYCSSIQSIDVSNWDTSGWPLATISNTWYYCYSLESLDLSGWDTSNWIFTDARGLFALLHSLTSYVPTPIKVRQSYDSMIRLSRANLVLILQALPTVGTSTTLTLGDLRRKLTSSDIAIATGKGWSVS